MRREPTRRAALKGMLNGAAVTVGLPLLDIFLDNNGSALAATGAPLPTRFGVWFWGLGINPLRFFPDKEGADYDLKIEAEPMAPYKKKINILSNFEVVLSGAPNMPHRSGSVAIRTGMARSGGTSFDVPISDTIGTKTRLRALDVSASGGARNSQSFRDGYAVRSETSPLQLYSRLFGPGFLDPNRTTFALDPLVMARRGVLSAVMEQRKAFEAQLGASDKRQLDRYFSSLRQLETQLELQLTKPEPRPACVVPGEVEDKPATSLIDDAVETHKLMTDLLVMALACDQTRAFNMNFSAAASKLTRRGSLDTHDQLTHEEPIDARLGYQPQCAYFINRSVQAWAGFVGAMDAVKEGDGTLLDHMLLFAHSEVGMAKFHAIHNIPMMTAGSANGKVKTGLHIHGKGTPVSRIGLTLQQVMGVPTEAWGTGSMRTDKTITELLA